MVAMVLFSTSTLADEKTITPQEFGTALAETPGKLVNFVKGEVEIAIDGESTVLKAGDIAFAPKGVPHTWKVVGSQKAKMITSALPAGIEIMFQELSELPAGPPDFEKVAEICAKQGITFV